MVLAWATIALLILLTGLYVAAEFGAVSARRSRLRRLAEDGNALAARVLPVLEDPKALDRYIAASQIGITLSSLILGAYGQATLPPRLAPLRMRPIGVSIKRQPRSAIFSVMKANPPRTRLKSPVLNAPSESHTNSSSAIRAQFESVNKVPLLKAIVTVPSASVSIISF